MNPDGTLQALLEEVGLVAGSTGDWGVAGIYAGAEREFRYEHTAAGTGRPLTSVGEYVWERGRSPCAARLTAVAAAGNVPTLGIHVYGANIGTIKRRSYDPESGAVRWFVSAGTARQPTACNNLRFRVIR